MPPATVQFIIAMIASALTDRLTRKMDYMREEQHILLELLHQATGKKGIAFTADRRRRLATKGKELTPKERKACYHIVRPETILEPCMLATSSALRHWVPSVPSGIWSSLSSS